MLDAEAARGLFEGDGTVLDGLSLQVGRTTFDLSARRRIVAIVNLSPDSPYRESVAVSPSNARRLTRMAADGGADIVELGLESTAIGAQPMAAAAQVQRLRPALEACLGQGVEIAVETRYPEVVREAMTFGVRMINLVGYEDCEAVFESIAWHSGAVVLPYLPSMTPASGTYTLGPPQASVSGLNECLRMRVEQARTAGIVQCVVDPAMGFSFEVDGEDRASYQIKRYLQLHGLHVLGAPVLATLVHAPRAFGGAHRRLAEPVMAVLALIGGVHLLRTHEASAVEAVRKLLDEFEL
jgi:dihydropteroate synthase